jgi:two-component system, chemotaxis family, chemotaxis protein CheY
MKILLIDDEALVRRTVGRILHRAGHAVVMAENGHDGVALLQTENPDLVITDIIMPDKEGIETIREIRELRPDLKIIAISGGGRLGNVDYLAMTLKLGASEALTKPFDPAELIEAVSRCLHPAT